jgi:NADH dehydrogenase FAD-containing subunit
MDGKTDVVVIGGGYAGVMAANRLTQHNDVTVPLINPRPTFVERIRLHQLVRGSDEAVVGYQEVLAEGVRLVVDIVTRINAPERSVTLGTGATLGYHYLIYAVGSAGADPRVPGAAEFAYPIAGLEETQRLLLVVDGAPAAASVTVVGGGPLGIETAAELAEMGRTVTLDRWLRRAGRGRAQRAEHDVAGRLLTDEPLTSVGRRAHRRDRGCGGPFGPAVRMSCQAALPLARRRHSAQPDNG